MENIPTRIPDRRSRIRREFDEVLKEEGIPRGTLASTMIAIDHCFGESNKPFSDIICDAEVSGKISAGEADTISWLIERGLWLAVETMIFRAVSQKRALKPWEKTGKYCYGY